MILSKVPFDLQQQVNDYLMLLLNRACKKLDMEFPIPKITYRNKGTVGATAHVLDWSIQLNRQLLLEHQHTFIKEIIPHELAHLLVFACYGRVKPHGKEWKLMMETILGYQAKRTHTFVNSAIQQQNYLYKCDCQYHYLSKNRHMKIQKLHTEYYCKKCGKKLVLNNEGNKNNKELLK